MYYRIIFSLCIFFQSISFCSSSLITYGLYGGRLGDRILIYIRAKYFAHMYKIPFLYRPFPYSDHLVMHVRERHYHNNLIHNKHRQKIWFNVGHPQGNTLFICHGDPTTNVTRDDLYYWMIRDPLFAREIKTMVAPRYQIQQINLPKDKITVAVHARRGSGTDKIFKNEQANELPMHKYDNVATPEKFPSDEYYIEQIKILSDLLDNKPLFVYLFTDAENPIDLTNYYKQAVNKDNIEFACRNTTHNGNSLVMEDLFAMTQFDCLIRSKSCLSYVAQLLGNHKVIIFVENAIWSDDGGVMVTKSGIIVRSSDSKLSKLNLEEINYVAIQKHLNELNWSLLNN